MTVAKADANGAGSATAIVADNAAPAKTKSTGQGSAASPGGKLTRVPKESAAGMQIETKEVIDV